MLARQAPSVERSLLLFHQNYESDCYVYEIGSMILDIDFTCEAEKEEVQGSSCVPCCQPKPQGGGFDQSRHTSLHHENPSDGLQVS